MTNVIVAGVAGIALALAAFHGAAAAGKEDALPKGFKVTSLLKSGMTATNTKIVYPSGSAEIVSVIGELEPGGRTAKHRHPVPVFVYVMEGKLTVQAEGEQPREYAAGQTFLESVGQWHQAFNKEATPTKILVVFAGAEGTPTTINAE